MFKLPKCKFCGQQTKLEKMESTYHESYDIVCSKCGKHHPIGFIKTYIYIKFNKNTLK